MNWSDIEKQHKASFNREYVACHEPAERGWLVEQVILTFPQYRKSVVERAIQEVCTSMVITPRKCKDFLLLLQQTLEEKNVQTEVRLKKQQG